MTSRETVMPPGNRLSSVYQVSIGEKPARSRQCSSIVTGNSRARRRIRRVSEPSRERISRWESRWYDDPSASATGCPWCWKPNCSTGEGLSARHQS